MKKRSAFGGMVFVVLAVVVAALLYTLLRPMP